VIVVGWMYWTWQSAVGFAALFSLLAGLAVLDRFRPGYARKGFLPMSTTRGDRVFMSIALFVGLVFAWLKVMPDLSAWAISGIAACAASVILRWG
jgi:predicted small integral membrane protein